MSLTQQFIILSFLPFSFLGMVAYIWRSEVPRRRVRVRWTLALIAAALWSSNVLRFYGGVTFSSWLVFTWGVVANYVFGVTALLILITTLPHLSIAPTHGRVAIAVSVVLWLASLGLDPSLWPYRIPDQILAGQVVRHFDIWAAVWIASWLLPALAAWILGQQARANYPTSLYRNQVDYWLLVLTLFIAGGTLASIRQPGQPVWQEVGVLFIIVAAFTGTVSIANSQMTELQLTMRQMLSRLSGTLILFGLTWAALNAIVQGVSNLPTETNPNLLLTVAAALFAGLFTVTYRLVNALTQRLFVPSLSRRKLAMSSYTNAVGNLPEPTQLGMLFLRIVQSNLSVDDAWIFTAEDGVQGRLILRPLASLATQAPDTVDFDGGSPFVAHLRENPNPLAQYDIDALDTYDVMPASEKEVLGRWQRILYAPLLAGDRLVGVLALGAKHTGESYERRDLELLVYLAGQISPLLAQSRNLASLRKINDHLFRQNQTMARKNTHLSELAKLNSRFLSLISPELRQPYATVSGQVHQLQESLEENEDLKHLVADLNEQIGQFKAPIDYLIRTAAQIQKRDAINFQPAHLDEITQKVIRGLKTMAEARKIRIEFELDPSLPAVLGDEQQLQEAVQHLLHNAIKYNKIGGVIQLDHAVIDGHVCLRVVDSGVGISEAQLEKLWSDMHWTYDGGSQGAGLGLALTQYIVAAHGGYIRTESKEGSGSTFSIFLPVMPEE